MTSVTITALEAYAMHNNEHDDALREYERAVAAYRHALERAYAAAGEDGTPDLSGIEEPVYPTVPEVVPALKVFFEEGDDDPRGLFVCVLATASTDEIAAAIEGAINGAGIVKPGQVIEVG